MKKTLRALSLTLVLVFLVAMVPATPLLPAAHAALIIGGTFVSSYTNESDNTTYDIKYRVTVNEYKVEVADCAGDAANIAIPATVTHEGITYIVDGIGSEAFVGNDKLTSIVMEESVTNIKAKAFSGCTNLESVTLSEKLTAMGEYIFNGCTKLTEIALPSSITTCSSSGPFAGSSLSKFFFDETIKIIPDNLFRGCTSLKEFTIPKTVEIIGKNAFYNCIGLTTFTTVDSILTTIDEWAFYGCSSLGSFSFPVTLTTIGISAFQSCTSLTSVIIPNYVTSIGNNAFANCVNVKEVTLSTTLNYLGGGAFLNCKLLKTIDIPRSLATCGSTGPFYQSGLTSVTFQEGRTKISDYLFRGSTLLNNVEVPETVEYIGSEAFYGCYSLNNIIFLGSVITIGQMAFAYCTSLVNFEIPASVTTIGFRAFSECENIMKMDIPDNVTTIGSRAFEKCTSLRDVKLSSKLESLGEYVFGGCADLETIRIPKSLTTCIGEGPFNSSGLISVTFEPGMTGIPDNLFRGSTNLVNVPMLNTMKTIGSNAFRSCTSLAELNIPESVTEIKDYAFYECTALPQLVIPNGVTAIGNYAFEKCTALRSITLSENLTSLGQYAFRECAVLSTIEIPASLTTCGIYGPFNGSSLTTVTFAEGMTHLPANLFRDSRLIRSVTIPNSVTSIGNSAFSGCTGLEEIIMLNVTSIGDGTFSGCSSLRMIGLPDSMTTFGTGAFQGCTLITLYCREYSKTALYAIENGVRYKSVSDSFVDDPSFVLARPDNRYIFARSGLLADGNVNLRVDYAVKADKQSEVSDMKVTVLLPTGAVPAMNTVTLDDTPVANAAFTSGNRTLTIPVTNMTGTIRFSVKPAVNSTFQSYAKFNFRQNNTNKNEVIGLLNESLPLLTLETVTETNTAAIPYSGTALPDKKVTLSIRTATNNSKVGEDQEIVAGIDGRYSGTLTIPVTDDSDNMTYKITATSLDAADIVVSAERLVRYLPGTPTMTEFEMTHNYQKYKMSEEDTMNPIIIFNPAEDFNFTVTLSNTDKIEDVYIVSTRNNVKKYLKATWNAASGTYMAAGKFDPYNPAYVPGVLTVEYVKKGTEVYLTTPIDFTAPEYVNTLPLSLANATATLSSSTVVAFDTTIEFNDSFETKLRFTYEEEDLPAMYTQADAVQNKFEYISDSSTNYMIMLAEDEVTGGNPATILLDFAARKKITVTTYNLNAENFAIVYDWYKDFAEIDQNRVGFTSLKTDVMASNKTAIEKQILLEQIARAEYINNHNAVVIALNTLAEKKVGLINYPSIDIMVRGMNYLVKNKLEATLLNLKQIGATSAGSGQINFRWAIDPSGFVYDELTLEPIAGAEATLYYKATPDGIPVEWNSIEYRQYNLSNSDAEGRYAWDAPAGFWQVRVTHPDYNDFATEWLDVPPQKDVDIGMIPKVLPPSAGNPSVDVGAGSYFNSVTVKVNCATPDAKIYYTTDGTDPTARSAYVLSGGSITIQSSMTLKFMACAPGHQKSDIVSVDYTIRTTYTVVFKSDNVNIGQPQEVLPGRNAVAPNLSSRTGYTFKGWDKTFTNVSQDLIVNAIWEINKYTVTFRNDWVTIKTQTVDYGKAASAPGVPAKAGHTFKGWDQVFDNITRNLTVNTVWEANKYTVTFKNGTTVLQTQTIEYGRSASAPAIPSRVGYTFDGWDNTYTNISKNLVINAKWRAKTYTVIFNGNHKSAIGSMGSQYYRYDETTKLPANAFTRKGYTFAGWAKTAKGKVAYTNKKKVKNLAAEGTVTLYAKWTKVTAPAKAPSGMKLSSPKKKQLKVTYRKVTGAKGYRIRYSTSKKFTVKTTTTVHTTKLTYTIKKLKSKQRYYVRVTAYKVDSTKAKVYSKKSTTKNLKAK